MKLGGLSHSAAVPWIPGFLHLGAFDMGSTVPSGALTALQDHFAQGRQSRTAAAEAPAGEITVMELPAVNPAEGPVTIAADGSFRDEDIGATAAAAVTSDDHALICWSAEHVSSQFAEMRALQMGVRLALQRPDATLLVDGQAYDILQWNIGRVFDAAAYTEIHEALPHIRVERLPESKATCRITHEHPVMRKAHVLAWLSRRMIEDGIDPRQEGREYLEYRLRGATPRTTNNLVQKYVRWQERALCPPIEDLGAAGRARSSLMQAGITTREDLASWDAWSLLALDGIGILTLAKILRVLGEHGFVLTDGDTPEPSITGVCLSCNKQPTRRKPRAALRQDWPACRYCETCIDAAVGRTAR